MNKKERAEEKKRKRGDQWKAYYAAHKEPILNQQREYRHTTRGHLVRKAAARRRNARMRLSGGALKGSDWDLLRAAFGYKCAYCGRAESEVGPFEPDHATPVARGGRTTLDNIRPACPTCNQRKGDQSAEEFLEVLAKERRLKP